MPGKGGTPATVFGEDLAPDPKRAGFLLESTCREPCRAASVAEDTQRPPKWKGLWWVEEHFCPGNCQFCSGREFQLLGINPPSLLRLPECSQWTKAAVGWVVLQAGRCRRGWREEGKGWGTFLRLPGTAWLGPSWPADAVQGHPYVTLSPAAGTASPAAPPRPGLDLAFVDQAARTADG